MTEKGQKLPVVQTGRPGRPPYDDAVREKLLRNLRMGDTRAAACGGAGVGESTFHRWLNDIEHFRDRVVEAENTAEHLYTGRLVKRAQAGDTIAIKFWLERRRAKVWRERTTVEIGEAPLEEELEDALEADARRQRLLDLAAEAQRRAATGADGSAAGDGPDAAGSDVDGAV